MPKVFVPVDRGYDYSKAARFGELFFVCDGELQPLDTTIMHGLWKLALSNSEKEDWIMITSLASHLAIGAAEFASKHGRLNLLIFHHGDYISQTMQMTKEKS